jgi:type IV pilus assembly protein PilY1
MTEYGFRAAQCNGVAYDPTVNYLTPVDSTGASATTGTTAFMDPSTQVTNPRTLAAISAANWPAVGGTATLTVTQGSPQNNWFNTGGNDIVTVYGNSGQFFIGIVTAWSSSTTVLKIKVLDVVGSGALSNPIVGKGLANTYFTYPQPPAAGEPALIYSYDTSTDPPTLITTNTFYTECNSKIGSTPGSTGSRPTRSAPARRGDEQLRQLEGLLQHPHGHDEDGPVARLQGLDARYRVGFSTISARTAVEGTTFLNIRDFDAAQKATFYADLKAANPSINTPLRAALAKAGLVLCEQGAEPDGGPGAVFLPAQLHHPVDRRLLEHGLRNEHLRPLRTEWRAVGQQDNGATPRPMFDGGSVTATTTEKWTRTVTTPKTVETPQIITSTVTTSSPPKRRSTAPRACSGPRRCWSRASHSMAPA